MPAEKNSNISLSSDDLKDIISSAVSAAVAEAKKPVITDADIRRMEQDQLDRAQQAALTLQERENKQAFKRICTHKHRRGDTHCVHIQDDLGGYVLCQKCQAVIRPGTAPAKYTGTVLYDTDLFNRMFQDCASNGFWE